MRKKGICSLLLVGLIFSFAGRVQASDNSFSLSAYAKTIRNGVLSSNINKNKTDDYEYVFLPNHEFDNTNGDEFEKKDAIFGIHSSITSIDEHGNEHVIKEEGIDSDIEFASFNDSHEDNDDFKNATNMYSAGQDTAGVYIHSVWCQATISQKTSGWWLWETKYIDKDVYSFDVVSVGTLEVTVTNIPTNCDYDLRLYRLEDGPDADCGSLDFANYLKISAGTSSTEKITISATPGTYYACVYSYNDKTYDNDNPYSITFEERADISRDGASYDIEAGREAGDIGAMWVSDYKPLGSIPVASKNSDSSLEITNYDEYPYIRHLADKYNSKENYINYAVLYIWDLESRAIISEIAAELVKIVDEQTDWDSNANKNVNIAKNGAGLVLSIAGLIIGTVTSGGIAGAVATALSIIGTVINVASVAVAADSFFECFKTGNHFVSSKKDLLAYLVSVQQTFSVGKGSNEEEVKILRYRYRFRGTGSNCFLDWSPFYLSTDYNFYNERYIYDQIENSGINGTVHGLETHEDIDSTLG